MNKKILAIALGLSCIAGVSQAEQVNFAGTVSTSCAFGNNQTGALNAYGSNGNYKLDAGFTQGTPAQLDITYTGAPTFEVTAVNDVQGSNGVPSLSSITTGLVFSAGANQAASNAAGANSFTSGSKSFTLDSNVSSDTVGVKMLAQSTNPFPVGNYTANTTVTCQ